MGKDKRSMKRRKLSSDDSEEEKAVGKGVDDGPPKGKEQKDANETQEIVEQDMAAPVAALSDGRYRNKQRCLVLCSRGVTARYRHLLEDLRTLLPHHKKESKLDPGKHQSMGQAVQEICEMRSCNTVLFLECRKRTDCYLWLGHVGGPSAKFHVANVHTMDELRLTGNCLQGSRPVLTFDSSFNEVEHLKLLKELFVDVFGTPRGHPKSKPFVDRIMAFYYADERIWVRNYQILEQKSSNALEAHQLKKESGQAEATSLVEIGPRFVLNPIRIFRGAFGGQTLFSNESYVSPNEVRAAQRRKNSSYRERQLSKEMRKEHKSKIVVPEDPLDSVFR